MTSFFAWNMRGFNQPRKHTTVRKWIQEVKPLFGCLLETRVLSECHTQVINSTFPGWNYITNYDKHRLGRIWFFWTDAVRITTISRSSQHITVGVEVIDTGISFICTAIYASNFVSERAVLWEELLDLQAAYAHLTLLWIFVVTIMRYYLRWNTLAHQSTEQIRK